MKSVLRYLYISTCSQNPPCIHHNMSTSLGMEGAQHLHYHFRKIPLTYTHTHIYSRTREYVYVIFPLPYQVAIYFAPTEQVQLLRGREGKESEWVAHARNCANHILSLLYIYIYIKSRHSLTNTFLQSKVYTHQHEQCFNVDRSKSTWSS